MAWTLDNLRASFDEIRRYQRENELLVVVHPDDVTDEMRSLVESTPFATLKETRYAKPGSAYVIRPGVIEGWIDA